MAKTSSTVNALLFTVSRSAPTHRSTCLPVLWYKYRGDADADDPTSSTDISTSWTLQEDWALLDQLGKFTVGEGDQTRTFWTQLAASTPALSPKSAEELFARCQVLKDNNDDDDENNNNTNRRYGPSPPLLTNWRLEGNRAVGTLDDGRVVWMNYHLVGRLPGDLFSDATSPSLMALIPGGYLEALGGRIYELGQPAREMKFSQPTTARKNDGGNIWQEEEETETSKSIQHATEMAWWVPGTTGVVSAMLASTVLSACIGYGAGLGIIADETGPYHHQVSHQQQQTSIPMTRDFHMIHHKSSSYSTPSVEERKARAEYRILKEQRLLQKISEQLEKDQADLQGLERLELYEQQARTENFLP